MSAPHRSRSVRPCRRRRYPRPVRLLSRVTHSPLPVNDMNAAFAELLEQQLAQGRDDAQAVWQAFAELVRRPVSPGGVAPSVSEDLIMFDLAAGTRPNPSLSLVRRVGLAETNGDYLRAVEFSCSLTYVASDRVAALPDGAVHRSFAPDRELDDVNKFLAEYEGTDQFKLLIAELTPAGIAFDP